MNSEINRLHSFTNWPRNLSVSINQLAKLGFYSTQKFLEIQCHFCSIKISNLSDQANLMECHSNSGVSCPYLNDPANCGNIPIELLDYKNEQIRVSTFKNWPVSFISAAAVAKAGFYYINRLDQVKCAWCQGVIGQWEVGDDPFYEHKKYFGHCPKASESSTNSLTNNFEVGVQAVRNPKMLVYSNLDSRIRTFANKWNYAHIQDPKKIAEAGFYYQGNEDEVRCFYCDGGLRFWLKNDDPWFEHARWFPLCQFVQLVKGEGFIANIQEEATRNINNNIAVQPSTAMTLDEALATEPVQMALQMGLNAGRVRAVTKKYLERTGRAMASSEALVEAVLEGQINDEDSESSFSNNRSIENEVSRILWSALSSAPTMLSNSPPPTTSDMNQASSSTSFSPSPNSTATVTSAEFTTHTTETSDVVVLPPDAKSVEVALAEENKRLRDARECKICMAEEVGCVFIPCGHLVSCVQCAPAVLLCPLCRANIRGRVRTFLS